MYVSVIGAGECGTELQDIACQVGELLAGHGHVLVCGGLGGVMDAAARGCAAAGGTSVGILPEADRARASKSLTVSVPTDMGQARNAIVVLSGDAVIAVGGGYGTLSEIGFGLKMGKPVIGIDTWRCVGQGLSGVTMVSSAAEAVEAAERQALKT